jgi:general secretion pathway protein D
VAVQDGSTIVLGGLIKEDKNVTETKVPFLGDIPFLGHLFKNKTNNKKRDELIIFIRPTVMRTDAQAVAEAHRRARLLKAGEELELEKRFGSAVPGAPTSKLNEQPSNNIKPPATPAAKSGDTSSTEAERRDAKMKALQEQDEAASAAGNPQKAP